MTRWSTRTRRAAVVLAGVHLLQIVLLAASAVCDLAIGNSVHHAVSVAAAAPESDVHAMHGGTAAPEHHAPHYADASREPVSDAPHHTSHTTSCPMAMACVVTAIVVPVPTLATSEVHVGTARIAHDERVWYSTRQAPEPPPPRG